MSEHNNSCKDKLRVTPCAQPQPPSKPQPCSHDRDACGSLHLPSQYRPNADQLLQASQQAIYTVSISFVLVEQIKAHLIPKDSTDFFQRLVLRLGKEQVEDDDEHDVADHEDHEILPRDGFDSNWGHYDED